MLQDRFTHPLLGNKILKKLPIEEEQTNIFSQLVFFILSIDREKRCNVERRIGGFPILLVFIFPISPDRNSVFAPLNPP